MSRIFLAAFALIAVVAFAIVFAAFVAFLLNWPVPFTIDGPKPANTQLAIANNLFWIALFGVTHSVLARESVKRILRNVVPEAAERSAYVLQSSIFLGLIIVFWQPVPPIIWSFEGWAWWAATGLALAGAGLILAAALSIDVFEFTGLRQTWCAIVGRPLPAPRFRTPLLYRIVRHPLQAGLLVLMFATPQMSAGHLLFGAAMTLYIRIGLYYEERALVRIFDDTYRQYRVRVPMLLPRFPKGFWRSDQSFLPRSVARRFYQAWTR